ncbi:MAG TPA: hypothetical protein PLZ93_05335 [Nocardioides sp.]|nr:hypothetical protein [Nocardioides sp.]HRI95012.1 hypothetical protein [Nocardioides sp.]HRK44887.1 hypothetical protein [Nocardioides sp.]
MLPDLLVDRSLGGQAVPSFLKSAWQADVRTLDEVFGAGRVPDTEWMALADENGWVAACKDDRIRTRPGSGC